MFSNPIHLGNLPNNLTNKPSTQKLQELFAKDEHPDFELVKKYVSEGANVKERSNTLKGSSPLEIVFFSGCPWEVEILLQNVISITEERLIAAISQNPRPSEMWNCLCSCNATRNEKLVLWDAVISCALRSGQVRHLWSFSKDIPQFMEKVNGFYQSEPMHWKDWCNFVDSDSAKFQLPCGVSWNEESTLKLQELFAKDVHPGFELVEKYVSEGANVKERSTTLKGSSPLEIVFRMGTPGEVRILLQNVNSITEVELVTSMCQNFNAGELLRYVCSLNASLCKKLFSYDFFFNAVAAAGFLHEVDAELGETLSCVSSFSQYRINRVWRFDRELLKQRRFIEESVFSGATMYEGDKITATVVLLLQGRYPDPLRIRKCLEEGVYLGWQYPFAQHTLLSFILVNTPMECVRATLQVSNPIDFTVKNIKGWSPLHEITHIKDKQTAKERLQLVLKRVEQNPEDKIDFAQKTPNNYDFLSLAAKGKKLSVLWPVVRDFPYFADKLDAVPVNGKVYLSDWRQLSESDQKRLSPWNPVIDDIPVKDVSF